MKFNLGKQFDKATKELNGMFGLEFSQDGLSVDVKIEGRDVVLDFYGGVLHIFADCITHVFWALKYFSDNFNQNLPEDGYKFIATAQFFDLTYMLDCSRNAVYKVETVKKLARMLAVMGYNSIMLYAEDTYVVPEYPYFGYLRNPYTAEDIEEIQNYCEIFGIEIVPCIQTLAHFTAFRKHVASEELFDYDDILMVGEPSTYQFIETLISTCRKYFKSKRIHIGMDEAYMLGRGKYLDKNGYRDRSEIMVEHLQKVVKICKKYDFQPMMWSDMFFSAGFQSQYADNSLKCGAEKVPEEVELIYWDYYGTNPKQYNERIEKHKIFPNKIGFAGGAVKWLGFTPNNEYSFSALKAAAKSCKLKGIGHFIVTGWGDNGAESSCFANLPAIYCASQINFGNYSINSHFKNGFKTLCGMCLKDFLTVDLANKTGSGSSINTENKYLLFNDILLGTLDTLVMEGTGEIYKDHAKKLSSTVKRANEFAYIFETQRALCDVLAIKAEIGVKIREAYQRGVKAALAEQLKNLKNLPKKIEIFYDSLRKQWDNEARPNGFDVQDIRIGALKQRVRVAIDKITDYLDGKTTSVSELEENLLCYMGHGDEYEKNDWICECRWRRISSLNINE